MRRLMMIAMVAGVVWGALSATAVAQNGYRVEGHVFNAETGRPLVNAFVDLHAFPIEPGFGIFSIGIVTDEGGFYRFEFQPLITDADGDDVSVGYAFAYSCNGVVQIVPLYTRLHPDRVYQRNIYLNVPANVRRCD